MAAKKRRLPATQDLPLPVGGGMFTSGDLAKIPPNCSPKIKNMFVRPGPRVEKRPGWDRETTLPAGNDYFSRIFGFAPTSSQNVVAIGAGGGTRYSAYNNGAWHVETAISRETEDAAILADVMYGSDPDEIPPRIWSWDGSTFVADAAVAGVGGRTIAAFNNRLFIGYVHEKASNLLTTQAYKFEDNTVWALAGGPPTVAVAGTLRTLTVVGATDTAKTVAAIYTTGASDTFITVQLPFRANNAAADMPFLVTLEDAAGANVYASVSVLVVNRTIQPDWQTYVIQGRIPSGTAVYLKYAAGTPLLSAVTGSVVVADATTVNVITATVGRRVYGFGGTGSAFLGGVYSYPSRFAWCEVNDASQWRATSYYDCLEVPGTINAIRELNGQLFVFKLSAIWIFNALDNASLPIQFARRINDVGCISVRAIATYNNELFFVGLNEVWRIGQGGDPQPLAGDAMRETLFADVNSVIYPCLAIDDVNKDVYVHVRPGKIDIYNIASKAWSYLTITGAGDSELELADMAFVRNPASGLAELWVSMLASPDIVKLSAAATRDSVTGVVRDSVAEYTFRPFQTQPLGTMLIESLDIDHAITSDQSTSTTSFELSYDGGATFPNANTITVSPLAGADYQPMTVPLWESQDRILVNLKHTGAAGPRAFNLSGARAHVQVLGPRTQRLNPASVSSTL